MRARSCATGSAGALTAEFAGTVTYLASPETAFVIGIELIVDGGMSQL